MLITTLENDHLKVEIIPELGASLVSCAIRLGNGWINILRPTHPEALAENNVSQMASYLLAPYSNRLRNARFSFNGRTYQLRSNVGGGHAIHGDVRNRPWMVKALRGHSLTLNIDSRDFDDFNFPFPLVATVHYELAGDAFDTIFTLTNVGGESMPAGFGFHPYFNRVLTSPADKVELQMRVRAFHSELIPCGPARPLPPEHDFSTLRPLAHTAFDHCYSGWDGKALIRWPSSGIEAHLECEEPLNHLVLYAPLGQSFFALEPVTHANNGFNLLAAGVPDSGIKILEPNEALQARFRLRIIAF